MKKVWIRQMLRTAVCGLLFTAMVVTLFGSSAVKAEDTPDEAAVVEGDEMTADMGDETAESGVTEDEIIEDDTNVSGNDVIEEDSIAESDEVADEDLQNQITTAGAGSWYMPMSKNIVDMSTVFSSWTNYPDSSLGTGYEAGWYYNTTSGLSTSKNVGWTGFYNPGMMDFTTGTFEFDLQSSDHDPLGFTWGMTVGGTATNPSYSFYAFEECGHGNWSVAYISDWKPASDPGSHRGPLYHSTIDARDGQYASHSGGSGTVGFSTGTVLAYGKLPTSIGTPSNQHSVKIEVFDSEVKVYLNGSLLTTVPATVQKGSFGPFATSNPQAHILGLSFQTSDKDLLNAKFEYRIDGSKVNETTVGVPVSVVDLSTYDVSPIKAWEWVVTKDGVEIYRGSTPYSDYHLTVGTYVTTLVVANENGVHSEEYSDTLVVKEAIPTPEVNETPEPEKEKTVVVKEVTTAKTAAGKTGVKTGDSTSVAMTVSYIALALFSLLVILMTALMKKKSK